MTATAPVTIEGIGPSGCDVCGTVRSGLSIRTSTPAGNQRPAVYICWRCAVGPLDEVLSVNITNQLDQWLWMKDNAARVKAGEEGAYERGGPRRKDTTKRNAKRAQASRKSKGAA